MVVKTTLFIALMSTVTHITIFAGFKKDLISSWLWTHEFNKNYHVGVIIFCGFLIFSSYRRWSNMLRWSIAWLKLPKCDRKIGLILYFYFFFKFLQILGQCLHRIAKDNSKIIIWKISRWRKQKSPPSIEFETWKIVINHLFLFYSFNPLWLLWKFWATFQVVEIGAVILSLHLSSCHSWFPSSFLVIIVEAKVMKRWLGLQFDLLQKKTTSIKRGYNFMSWKNASTTFTILLS